MGSTKKKILLLLLGGLALGLSRSPRTYFKIIKGMREEWEAINQQGLRRAIQDLYRSHLVEVRPAKNNQLTLILSERGKKVALTYDLENMRIPRPVTWDKRWRIVIFDIPEKIKKVRESIRFHLRDLGFRELQKSVFIFPYDCSAEIDYIREFYNARRFIRFIVAESLDNELHMKNHFCL